MGHQKNTFKISSYNIRYNNTHDKEDAWPYRKEMVASMIRFHHLDIIGVQEALKEQMNDLERLLPEYNWIGVGREDGKSQGEFAAIFYKKDKFECKQQGTFWLSENPDTPGSMGWDAACVRIATWGEFMHKDSGETFYHFNTHFDHVGPVACEKSGYLLLERVRSIAGRYPVLVTGDLNCTTASKAYQVLIGNDKEAKGEFEGFLKDAYYLSEYPHHGPTVTFLGGFHGEHPVEKIDYIFIKNNVHVLHHGILSDHWNGRYTSDHMPVVAEVSIEA